MRPLGSLGTLGLTLLVSGLLALGFQGSIEAAEQPSADSARAEFQQVCEAMLTGTNVYFGSAAVDDIQRDLRLAIEARRADIATRAAGYLGSHLIRLGRHEEAIDNLRPARQTADRLFPDELPLRRRLGMLLAVAHLQRAEDENCIENHTARSCILPVDPSAVHTRPDQGREAFRIYRELATRHPQDVQVRWLLNVTAMLIGVWPDAVPESLRLPETAIQGATAPESGAAAAGESSWGDAWTDVAPRLGVDSFDLSGGVVLDDFDGDGLLDIVSTTWDPCGPMKAWRNDGRGGFVDVAATWRLTHQLGGLNLVQADVDNDGDLDLLVLRGGWLGADGRTRNSLLRNDLDTGGGFVDITATAGLDQPAYPTQAAAFADVDLDGDLDLYIGNETASKQEDILSFIAEPGPPYPSQLFRNDGVDEAGIVRFTDIASTAGVTNDRFTKGVAWGDADDDGDPDLYVSNIGANRLYRNDGLGEDGTIRFTDVATAIGVSGPSEMSFASWFFDADNDGDLDLFVSDYKSTRAEVFAGYFGTGSFGTVTSDGHPVLYRNDGGRDGTGPMRFTDVSADWGLRRPVLPMGANYGDLDNDGWLDVYLGTGTPQFDAIMPNVMLHNVGGRTAGTRRFADVTMAGGFGHLQKGHGVAFGDLDNDGDQDLYEQMGGAFPYDAYGNVLYENPGNDSAWTTIRLVGTKANRFGVGARIATTVALPGGGTRTVHAVVGSGGSFGASSLQQEIGLGDAQRIVSIEIRWPGGTVDRHLDLAIGRVYRATEAGGIEIVDAPPITLDTGASTDAAHVHGLR